MLHVELVSEVASREKFAQLAAEWLSSAKDLVFPGFDDAMEGGLVPFDPPAPTTGYWILGRPTALEAGIYVQRRPVYSLGRAAKYSKRSWRRLLDGLAEAYPYRTTLFFGTVDASGANAGWGTAINFAVHREHDAPECVRFEASVPEDIVDWRGSAEIQERWVSFVRDWTARVETCYGHITDDADFLATALERATGRYSWDTVPRCRQVLRGYSWVTVCPAGLAARLGGPARLAQSAAFCEVAGVAGGSVFLRATRTLEEYDGEATRRVFEALAPVLLTGRVGLPEREEWIGRLVIGVDAADYQERQDS